MVYVDKLFEAVSKNAQAKNVGSRNGHKWCHMWADEENELHELAQRIGLKKSWYQTDSPVHHYDLTPNKRRQALEAGAKESDIAPFVEKALRLKKMDK